MWQVARLTQSLPAHVNHTVHSSQGCGQMFLILPIAMSTMMMAAAPVVKLPFSI